MDYINIAAADPISRNETIDSIFVFESTRARQRGAPLFREREVFLSSLLLKGTGKARLRSLASMLLHVIRTLNLSELRVIGRSEIERGALLWVKDLPDSNRNGQPKSATAYVYAATSWLRFHGKIANERPRIEPDDTYVEQLVTYLTDVKGRAQASVSGCRLSAIAYLKWNAVNQLSLGSITPLDVDRYLLLKINAGYKPMALASLCRDLKVFFRFAEEMKWITQRISAAIQSPRIPRSNSEPKGPLWHDVRRLLNHDFGSKPTDLRAAAAISLSAIYGFRNSEVIRLQLSSFDWVNEFITIKRAKSGRIQRFPLQIEVGEKVLAYLKYARPKCTQRAVFVSLNPPFRPINRSALWLVVSQRLKALGIQSRNFGTHALRHACATQLLCEGSSLPEIAQFLGHSDLKSVSIYAKHDIEALRQVASFGLGGLL